ncbi:hypothetical protein RFI_24098, partial [Reticulomyxa filosa]
MASKKTMANEKALERITVTCEAPVNIALTKYWGKNEDYPLELNIPLNNSISITLDPTVGKSRVYEAPNVAQWQRDYAEQSNAACDSIDSALLLRDFATKKKRRKRKEEKEDEGDDDDDDNDYGDDESGNKKGLHNNTDANSNDNNGNGNGNDKDSLLLRNFRYLQIRSHNNFPTSAGLQSSASGFAALTCALCKIYAFMVALCAGKPIQSVMTMTVVMTMVLIMIIIM